MSLKFICPHCQSPLIPHAKTWTCDGSKNDKLTQHPFDVAKQGYVNLLPVQRKKSKTPGDSGQSIEARHRFLQAGHYEPLLDAIKGLVADSANDLANNQPSAWLDVGCGDGYYTFGIVDALSTTHQTKVIAVDISKPAVIQLSKTVKQICILCSQNDKHGIYPLVASASNLPLADKSVTGISSIFSPIIPAEFARVMRAGGRLIIAKPDVRHLASVREVLFDTVRPHDSDKFLLELEPYFSLNQRVEVTSELRLDGEAMADLLTMTPYAYRAKRERREALFRQAETGEFETTAKFLLYELVKKAK